jgi:hypothetical protein
VILGATAAIGRSAGAAESAVVKAKAARYIAYSHDIRLTPAQEQTKQEALQAIPAPCCASFSIATCCCPCNLAKSVWGLSNQLIAEQGLGVEAVRAAAKAWIAEMNSEGFGGDACFRGGCNRPFHEDGCGGMSEADLR